MRRAVRHVPMPVRVLAVDANPKCSAASHARCSPIAIEAVAAGPGKAVVRDNTYLTASLEQGAF